MRTALYVLLALSTLAPMHEADACGGSYVPEPRVLQLSTHVIPGQHRRSFVVLGGADGERAWKRLAPMSYDSTRIAWGTTLVRPMTFTIVGKDGTKIVTGRNLVFLSQTFEFVESASAIEVPWAGDRALVIEGSHADAKWLDLTALRGEDIELTTKYDELGKPSTSVKRGEYELGRFAGRAVGLVEVAGERRLVFGDGAWTSSAAI